MQGSDIYIYICLVNISESQHLVLCFFEVLQIFVWDCFCFILTCTLHHLFRYAFAAPPYIKGPTCFSGLSDLVCD